MTVIQTNGKNGLLGEPAKAGELISGKFFRASSGGNFALDGTITYGAIKDISFNKKGQFTTVTDLSFSTKSDQYFWTVVAAQFQIFPNDQTLKTYKTLGYGKA